MQTASCNRSRSPPQCWPFLVLSHLVWPDMTNLVCQGTRTWAPACSQDVANLPPAWVQPHVSTTASLDSDQHWLSEAAPSFRPNSRAYQQPRPRLGLGLQLEPGMHNGPTCLGGGGPAGTEVQGARRPHRHRAHQEALPRLLAVLRGRGAVAGGLAAGVPGIVAQLDDGVQGCQLSLGHCQGRCRGLGAPLGLHLGGTGQLQLGLHGAHLRVGGKGLGLAGRCRGPLGCRQWPS